MRSDELLQLLGSLATLLLLAGVIWWLTRGREMLARRGQPSASVSDLPQAPVQPPAAPPVTYAPQTVAAPPPPPQAVPPPPTTPVAPPAPAVPYQRLDQRLREVEAMLGQLARERTTAGPVAEADVRAQVYQLLDEGVSLPEIARQLTLARGEVELLDALRRARPESDQRPTPA